MQPIPASTPAPADVSCPNCKRRHTALEVPRGPEVEVFLGAVASSRCGHCGGFLAASNSALRGPHLQVVTAR